MKNKFRPATNDENRTLIIASVIVEYYQSVKHLSDDLNFSIGSVPSMLKKKFLSVSLEIGSKTFAKWLKRLKIC